MIISCKPKIAYLTEEETSEILNRIDEENIKRLNKVVEYDYSDLIDIDVLNSFVSSCVIWAFSIVFYNNNVFEASNVDDFACALINAVDHIVDKQGVINNSKMGLKGMLKGVLTRTIIQFIKSDGNPIKISDGRDDSFMESLIKILNEHTDPPVDNPVKTPDENDNSMKDIDDE